MSDDEDVCVCDECQDIFLSQSALKQHMEEEHGTNTKELSLTGETEDTAAGKRPRSPSKEPEQNGVKRKKIKMGPASRVKRDRSSSEETEGPSIDNGIISNILDNLASTESDGEKSSKKEEHFNHEKNKDRDKDKERDRDKKKDKDGDRDRDKKEDKVRDQRKDKDRDRERDSHKEKNKKKHKDRDRNREKEKKRSKEKEDLPKSRESRESTEKRALADSSDDEERNRKRSEKAKAEWMRKNDLARGKEAKYKSNGLNGFIVDDEDHKSKKPKQRRERSRSRERPEKTSVAAGGGFASQGTVKAHDNETGPECFKCGQICKDNSNLKNHVLSHYYQVFYDVLPDSKPFPCPECGNTSRDRITLVRHFAFTHKKLFEMTDVTPEHFAGFGNRKSVKRKETGPRSILDKRNENGEKARKIDYGNIVDSDSGEEDVEEKIKQMKSKYLKVSDGVTKNHSERENRKDHKKHKKHKHKDHKHKKDKKHKKDRHRDREREEAPAVNPLGSLLKDLSPDSSTSGRSQSRAPPEVTETAEDPSNNLPRCSPKNEAEQNEDDSDDFLDDDFATPVFA